MSVSRVKSMSQHQHYETRRKEEINHNREGIKQSQYNNSINIKQELNSSSSTKDNPSIRSKSLQQFANSNQYKQYNDSNGNTIVELDTPSPPQRQQQRSQPKIGAMTRKSAININSSSSQQCNDHNIEYLFISAEYNATLKSKIEEFNNLFNREKYQNARCYFNLHPDFQPLNGIPLDISLPKMKNCLNEFMVDQLSLLTNQKLSIVCMTNFILCKDKLIIIMLIYRE